MVGKVSEIKNINLGSSALPCHMGGTNHSKSKRVDTFPAASPFLIVAPDAQRLDFPLSAYILQNVVTRGEE